MYRCHELSKRVGAAKVDELCARARAGESVRSLAREVGVANSALNRMLRPQSVEISKRKVSVEEAAGMAKEYEAGATVREIETTHDLSHGAVLRSLHRCGVEMQARTPR